MDYGSFPFDQQAALDEFRFIVSSYYRSYQNRRAATFWAFAMDGAAKVLRAGGVSQARLDGAYEEGRRLSYPHHRHPSRAYGGTPRHAGGPSDRKGGSS